MDMEAECYILWRIRKTTRELCYDRGYAVTPAKLNETFNAFKARIRRKVPSRRSLDFLVARRDDSTQKMLVSFPAAAEINCSVLRRYVERMKKYKIHRAIIVHQEELSIYTRKSISAISKEYVIECFLEEEMMYNVTHHELVPRHVLMTPREKTEVLKDQKVEECKLMRIKRSDPVARYYGFKIGQVIKIIRTGGKSGEYVTYRLVV